MANIKFVMEQHVGMQTFYENMRNVVDAGATMSAEWVEVSYSKSLVITRILNETMNHWLGTSMGVTQARRGLANNQADVTFFCTQVPALLAGGSLRQTPYVLCTDITPIQYDNWSTEYEHLTGSISAVEQYKFTRNRDCFQQASFVIAWSTWAAESLINDYHVDPERVEVVPPGVDLKVWQPGVNKSAEFFDILFVGSDFDRKGGHTLLEAFAQLPKDRFRLHLVTKADVPEQQGVHVYRDMTPNCPALIDLYQQAHIYVHPAKAEAYGIAAVEAAASGLPIITTPVGGLQSVVDDGVTGHLMPIGDVQKLRELLFALADDPKRCAAMGHAARQRAESVFDVNKNVSRVLAILQAAASGHKLADTLPPMRGAPRNHRPLRKRAIA